MFSRSYQLLPQRDVTGPRTPGLFVDSDGFTQPGHHRGLSFDNMPNVSENDFTDSTQGWLSWFCNLIVIFLVYICTFVTFPVSGWFVLKTVPNYQRIVVFRLGRVCPPKGPGIVLVLPLIDQWQRVDLRTRAFNIPPCQVTTRDDGLLLVGADIQFRIWNPVMSVISVQDLNASTRMTAQNALTHSLAKKTVREIQTERVKLGEYLVMDINELTRHWGLEVDRVELTLGSLLKAPDEGPSGPLIMPPSVPGLEGLTGPIQQLAMHFLGHSSSSQHRQEDSITFTDELSSASRAVVAKPGSAEELLGGVKLLLSESLVHQVGACFQFDITLEDGQHQSYYVDLSQGARCSSSLPVVRQAYSESGSIVRPFSEIPGLWKNGVANLYNFWKLDGFRNLHRIMLQNFNTFGPIYREKIGYYESVNIINPEDAAILFKAEGHYPKRLKVEAWTSYRDYRNRKYGVLLKNGEDWRSNRVILNKEVISPKVLENFVPLLAGSGRGFPVSSVLYGERLGLMLDYIDPEAQHFIDCITLMFKTTSPMLYIPPGLLRQIGAKVWRDHVEAWDGIFNQADRCIHNIYRQLRQEKGTANKYPGVLASLLMLDKLSIEDIKASITELMAGGVDTTSITLQWTLYELARHPSLQEELRAEVAAARAESQGDMLEMLKRIPLVKGALKETLRLHPVAVSLQRYIAEDIIIQNYHIPAGTLVQLGLYAMGRDPKVFFRPEQYQPSRWLRTETHYFRSLGFGFGPRQCLGRRIAEAEMQIFLIHMLENFRVEKQRHVEVQSTFELILLPDKPIILTLKPLDNGR
ncbi:Cholesterol side-chain cleavage enzyme [Nibea albiflora]|uniref:Cholesterol side-chain cleavage enzyme n=1 Tax=Nibea albiflora TaxID=240163 RepID=A0ACB7FF84_NIBAL|nr:Cholesterol side-chain cleavage enzyme [Nibea albiflora]